MEPDKTIAAVAALIGALTGLITALVGLVNALGSRKKHGSREQLPANEGHAEPSVQEQLEHASSERIAESLATKRSHGRTALVIGCLLLGLSVAVAGVLFFRAPSFDIKIMKPVPDALNVRPVDNGTSAEYAVEGLYSGPLENTYGIYVLVRPGNKSNEAWYLQSPPLIRRKDNWYRKGEWYLEKAYVGRSPNEPKLQTGEEWEIKALIAQESPIFRQLEGIEPAELAQKLPAIAESETVKVKIIINP
jgi:hypothetical protein